MCLVSVTMHIFFVIKFDKNSGFTMNAFFRYNLIIYMLHYIYLKHWKCNEILHNGSATGKREFLYKTF